MCLFLPARVVAIGVNAIEIEVTGGSRLTVGTDLCPEVAIDQYVLVDRGQVIKVIDAAEAAAIQQIYDEIGELLAGADEEAVAVMGGAS